MLHPEVLAMLVCPATHQDLIEASPGEVASLNELIRDGKIQTASGKEALETVDGALIRVDRAIAYPVRDDIPVMLVAEGLDIRGVDLALSPGVARNA